MSNRTPNGLTSKIKSFMGKNKQLFMGLVVGALIMLPTGLYVNERNNNRQIDQPTTTQEIKVDNDSTKAKSLEPVQEQPTPATQPATQQAQPAPKKSGVDCVALNNVQQALITDSENSNYQTYLKLKQLIQDDPYETPELKELNITQKHNEYQTAVNRQKYLAVNIITGAKCMPTVSVTFRAR